MIAPPSRPDLATQRGDQLTRPRPDIDPLYTCVTPVFYPGAPSHATGFFFRDDRNDLYLITNRHVVATDDGDPYVDTIRILTRPSRRLDDLTFHDVDLAPEGEPVWLEHPRDATIDIAAVPLDFPVRSGATAPVTSERIDPQATVPIAQRALILGYPLIEQAPYFPIKRDAMIASPYGTNYREMPCFKTDADMHSGTSGSPVFALTGSDGNARASSALHVVGIHSATVTSRHALAEGSLDLNITWYAELLADIVAIDLG